MQRGVSGSEEGVCGRDARRHRAGRNAIATERRGRVRVHIGDGEHATSSPARRVRGRWRADLTMRRANSPACEAATPAPPPARAAPMRRHAPPDGYPCRVPTSPPVVGRRTRGYRAYADGLKADQELRTKSKFRKEVPRTAVAPTKYGGGPDGDRRVTLTGPSGPFSIRRHRGRGARVAELADAHG